MYTEKDIKVIIYTTLKEVFKIDVSIIRDNTTLKDGLQLDSLDAIDLIESIEHKLNIELIKNTNEKAYNEYLKIFSRGNIKELITWVTNKYWEKLDE